MSKYAGYKIKDGDQEFRVGARDPTPKPDNKYPVLWRKRHHPHQERGCPPAGGGMQTTGDASRIGSER